MRNPFAPVRIGDRWGPPWSTTWFHVRGRVAAAGGEAEGRAQLVDPAGVDGEALRLRFRRLPTGPVPVDERVLPGPVSPRQGTRRGRPVGTGRRDVGRGRLQPPVG